MLFQEYHGLILNLFKLNCKVVWLAFLWHRYFPSLLKSNFHLVFSFSIFLLGDNICMLDFQAPSSKGEEEGEEEEEIHSPHHAGSSSSSFMETYPHFLAWQYEVMILDGAYSSMPLDRPKHTPNILWLDPVCSWKFLVPCPYFFLAYWMAHDLIDLCFRLMLILWRKVWKWFEACNW